MGLAICLLFCSRGTLCQPPSVKQVFRTTHTCFVSLSLTKAGVSLRRHPFQTYLVEIATVEHFIPLGRAPSLSTSFRWDGLEVYCFALAEHCVSHPQCKPGLPNHPPLLFELVFDEGRRIATAASIPDISSGDRHRGTRSVAVSERGHGQHLLHSAGSETGAAVARSRPGSRNGGIMR